MSVSAEAREAVESLDHQRLETLAAQAEAAYRHYRNLKALTKGAYTAYLARAELAYRFGVSFAELADRLGITERAVMLQAKNWAPVEKEVNDVDVDGPQESWD